MLPAKKTLKKDSSIVFYFFHLPALLLLIGFFAITAFISVRATPYITSESTSSDGNVLSSGSGKDGDDDDDNESDDDNDDDGDDSNDDNDNDENDDDGEDSSDDDGNDEDESDDDASSSGGSFDLNKSDDSNETKSEVKVQNADGTYSIIKTEEKDGELKKEIRTFDPNGNKLRVEKYESENGEEKSRVSVYDVFGNKISDIRLETEDGKELELRVKEGETELSRIKFDVEKQELIIRSNNSVFGTNESEDESDENKLRIRLDGNNFLLTRNGASVLSKFPLTLDDVTGNVFVQTPNGEISLGVMPDTIVEKAEALDDIDDVNDVALEVGDDSTSDTESATLEFKMAGTKSEKLLGVFALQIPSTVIYDAQTGEFLRSEQPFVIRLLDLFSF